MPTSPSRSETVWTSEATDRHARPTIAILLSIYNGEAYLAEQLASFLIQSHTEWHLYWRDDGSEDNSRAIMETFIRTDGIGRCTEIPTPRKRLGTTESFMTLLRAAPKAHYYAFADQDDVWLPHKLTWAVQTLSQTPRGEPHLYFARQLLTDEHLNVTGKSLYIKNKPSIYNALTQNISSGMSIVLNETLQKKINNFHKVPPNTFHDWWVLLITCATGSHITADKRCVLLYRQHNNNSIGARTSLRKRAIAAIKRGPSAFLDTFEANIAMLQQYPSDYLTLESRTLLTDLSQAHSFIKRLTLLRRYPALRRQAFLENIIFRLWYLQGGRRY
ncbi:glycosyltransferase [Neokomagataea thailandica]|uniref:Glycosyltransferase n=1 Tax=Neokomagataea tanensis NBRC 106556 TaxID=1223519 RepID=A0ABQ0QJA7_9PROT|nr:MULTISPECIES: glycosyltransferase [Neokomagataea]GBR46738.1 glycosyltransferase [Neokomagataea tanensis NBRC 106556]